MRHVSTSWVIYNTVHGPDLVTEVEKLHQRAVKNGYTVELGYTIEDANKKIRGMLKP